MLDCFPERVDAPAALGQAGALATILQDYPDDLIEKITDPARGMPVRQKWRPLPYELKQACEAEMAPLRRAAAREARLRESESLLLAAPSEKRPTAAEIAERFGEDYGIDRGEKAAGPRRKTLAEMEAETAALDLQPSEALLENLAARAERANHEAA